jgi:hypothetical protein
MISGPRLGFSATALVLLAGLVVTAFQYGVSGTVTSTAARELEQLYKSPIETEEWWQQDLRRAAAMVPQNPSAREILGLARAAGTNDATRLDEARSEIVSAIRYRPGSGYTWASLAAVKYRLGEADQMFERALVNAMQLAPFEPEVQRDVADYGLAVLDEVAPATRAAVEQAVISGMRRNPAEILQISSRRGRLSAACRHLDASMHPAASKWSKLCQSLEATS